MRNWWKNSRAVWLGIGTVLGLVIGGLWPQSPLHAVATDRADNFAIATGTVDEGVEGVFMLDFLTGELRGAVLNPNTPSTFAVFWKRNIMEDLKVETGKSPKFLMVTGLADVRAGGQSQYGNCVVYVAELTTGNMGVYAVPFNSSVLSRPGGGMQSVFAPLLVTSFRTAAVRQ